MNNYEVAYFLGIIQDQKLGVHLNGFQTNSCVGKWKHEGVVAILSYH